MQSPLSSTMGITKWLLLIMVTVVCHQFVHCSIEMFVQPMTNKEREFGTCNPGPTIYEECRLATEFGNNQFSWQCVQKDKVYKPNPTTTCVCVSFLVASCTKDGNSTTTTPPPPTSDGGRHPLEPLTADEIKRTTYIINKASAVQVGSVSDYIFNWITLQEPAKEILLPYFLGNKDPPEGLCPRKSFSVLISRTNGSVYEAIVNLDQSSVESFIRVDNVQPPITPEEMLKAEAIGRGDPEVAKRAAALGYPNMSLVYADPWSMGYIGDQPQFQGRRLFQLYLYARNFPDDNLYAHPFDFIAIVDTVQGTLVTIQDLPTHSDFDASNKEGNEVPKAEANYEAQFRGKDFLRTDDKPIIIESPEGPSFKVSRYKVEWQKWKFYLGWNGREGLVLHHIGYNDNGTFRPVLYRASLTEMFIPYGDPRPPYHRKAVFDMGEYGIGYNADSLSLGGDILGAAVFFDGTLNNSTGDPIGYKTILSVREEDSGILWKHVDYRTGEGVTVRSHRLVITFVATVGNYEYIYSWAFYQDGSIQLEIQLSGILSTNLLAVGATNGGYGSVVAKQINAQYHQHFFAVRLDTDIDGPRNSVHMSEVIPVPEPTGSPQNPYGQGIILNQTELKTAAEGGTQTSPLTGRVWITTNPSKIHPYSQTPVGWKLMPLNTPPLIGVKESSPLFPKGGFMKHDVWAIPYKEGQIFPGGFYLNNSGLPTWVEENPGGSLVNQDIVLYHIFGLTHLPRVEDYPVMPVEPTGFWFKPYNFFLENPAIDVPPAKAI